jgi:hypothetical protein
MEVDVRFGLVVIAQIFTAPFSVCVEEMLFCKEPQQGQSTESDTSSYPKLRLFRLFDLES